MLARRIFNSVGSFCPQRRLFSAVSASTVPPSAKSSSPVKPEVKRTKHKTPFRRASKLLNELRNEELVSLKAGREWPDFRAGDSIEVTKKEYISADTTFTFKGLVVGRTNRGPDSQVRTINVEFGTPVVRVFALYDPMITNIRVLEKAFIHKGKKRVRRSKIYYIEKRDPEEFTVV